MNVGTPTPLMSGQQGAPVTICIAAICDSCKSLVVASDSMITNHSLSIQFEHSGRKMTQLSDDCIALTAGDALAHTELFSSVEAGVARLKSPTVFEIVDTIKETYQRIRIREIEERILKSRGFKDLPGFYDLQRSLVPDVAMTIQTQIDRYDYGLEILVAGMDRETAHIYGIYDPGTSQCFDAIGFNAIGSGLPHALNTLLARECQGDMPLQDALMVVYEAKKAAEKAPGVGYRHTDISIIRANGITTIPRDTVNEVASLYQQWLHKDEKWQDHASSLLGRIGVGKS